MLVLAVAGLLALCGCTGDEGSGPETRPGTTSRPPAATPTAASDAAPPDPLSLRRVASQPVPDEIQGVALFGDKVAYADPERGLVWMSWRTGDRSTVARSRYGNLSMLPGTGRYIWVLDAPPGAAGGVPSSPFRVLRLDLWTGDVQRSDYPPHGALIGETPEGRFVEVVRHQRPDGRETGRSDLEVSDRAVTTDGRVTQAGYDLQHRVVWTESYEHGGAVPHQVWTAELDRPDPPQLLVDDAERVPTDPVAGRGWVGWTENGQYLVVTPADGGPQTRVPGHLAPASPSAYGRMVALVVGGHGRNRLEVFRVDP
jgi:hypothetical protein